MARASFGPTATNEEAQNFFNGCPTGQWDLVYLAARRGQCEWDLPIREFNISTLIPELKQLRDLGRLLAFRARIEISRGQFDNAIETLKTGFAMARRGEGPNASECTCGSEVDATDARSGSRDDSAAEMSEFVLGVTLLPDPMIDLSDGLAFEGSFVYLFLPELRDIRTAVHTESEWEKILLQVTDRLVKVLPGVGDQKKDLSWYGMGALFAVTAYPKAKQQLQEAGYSASKIKEMSAAQAVLTAEVETFDHLNNNTFKWFYVDDASALKRIGRG